VLRGPVIEFQVLCLEIHLRVILNEIVELSIAEENVQNSFQPDSAFSMRISGRLARLTLTMSGPREARIHG
jgi:hypothetical protein